MRGVVELEVVKHKWTFNGVKSIMFDPIDVSFVVDVSPEQNSGADTIVLLQYSDHGDTATFWCKRGDIELHEIMTDESSGEFTHPALNPGFDPESDDDLE
jgi:hypothetical protein